MNTNNYWFKNGKYQTLADELHKLIPAIGEIPNAKENPALEKYRKACRCYYDLYNNGLGNRAKEFRQVFGFAGTWIAKKNFPDCPQLETKMDEIIYKAGQEQHITV